MVGLFVYSFFRTENRVGLLCVLFRTARQYSLCDLEGEREVVPAGGGRELGVVEGVGQEVVQQRAERQPVRPARREVLQLYILQHHTNKTSATLTEHCLHSLCDVFWVSK